MIRNRRFENNRRFFIMGDDIVDMIIKLII